MPDVRTLPQNPAQLLEKLFGIFPEYRAAYTGPIHGDAPTFHSVLLGFTGPIHGDAPTFHSVLLGFTPFLGSASTRFSDAQLRTFADLINAAVENGGSLENAFGTCLLEHLHQIRALKPLHPYLSEIAREAAKA
jgi:hypothetical protein